MIPCERRISPKASALEIERIYFSFNFFTFDWRGKLNNVTSMKFKWASNSQKVYLYLQNGDNFTIT